MLSAADWLAACRRIVVEQRKVFSEHASIAERTVYDGIGEGGDHTLVIDRRCEDLVFDELERLSAPGEAFTAISEERGAVEIGSGSEPALLVIDPIDGSLNARRTLPTHCLSIAVASGPSMADVEVGFIHEFGANEEFVAARGDGARLNGEKIETSGPDAGLEVVGLESADPAVLAGPMAALAGKAWRIRAVGAIAMSLSYVAAGRFDGMLTAKVCRSVDAAAGQLIVREAGGQVEFEGRSLNEAPLDLKARYRLLAGANAGALEPLRTAQGEAPTPAEATTGPIGPVARPK